jgi:RNA polymerase subunit RPABC4/transcription elongation factor Spt4
MHKPLLGKTDECWNCGRRLSTKQKYCPCGKKNLDYKPRTWTGEIVGIEEDKRSGLNPQNWNEGKDGKP